MDKTAKRRKFIREAICVLIMLAGVVVHILFGLPPLATLLMAIGFFGFALIYGLNITKKYFKSKCSIGRRVRICHIVGFSVVIIAVVLMLIERDFADTSLRLMVFLGFMGMASYLGNIERNEDFLLEEQERKRKFEADDDLTEEVSFEK